MNAVKVEVTLVHKEMDWSTGFRKESKVEILVDSDKVETAKRMKLENLSVIPRNKGKHVAKPAYKLIGVGSTYLQSGDNSIASYLYNIKPGTRRIKGADYNDYSRKAYGI